MSILYSAPIAFILGVIVGQLITWAVLVGIVAINKALMAIKKD